jgi:paraquat-inducible protein B
MWRRRSVPDDRPQATEAGPAPAPEAALARRRGISLVWLIPLVAGAIALWLGYAALQERGPTITITFKSAEGLEAGKTRVKYKDVEVGLVEAVTLSPDLERIDVTARMQREIAPHLTESTRFWIVRPRIGAAGISGLSTLVSGAYVEMDPGAGEQPEATSFIGLEEPPPITSDVPGTEYALRTRDLGSVGRGSPVYYRDVPVGQVLAYELAEDKQSLVIRIFVDRPYDQLVRADSRFWNASGFQVALTADGLDVSVQSLQALLAGGIAFDTPDVWRVGEQAQAGTFFELFDSFASVGEASYTDRISGLVYFEDSVRGLRPGAPVELHGIKVGEVTGLNLEFLGFDKGLRVPVSIEIVRDRIEMPGGPPEKDARANLQRLVDRGLRAQLRSGNLLTGELYVALDFFPESPPVKVVMENGLPVVPAVPTQLEVLSTSATQVLEKLAALPLDDLVADVRRTVNAVGALATAPSTTDTFEHLNATAEDLEVLIAKLNQRLDPLLAQAQTTLSATDGVIGANSQIRYNLTTMLQELTGAARSIRILADYLERHPDALIRGKAGYDGR